MKTSNEKDYLSIIIAGDRLFNVLLNSQTKVTVMFRRI